MASEEKKGAHPSKNSWIKNTYFWIAAILLVLGVLGFIKGDDFIRDPGQLKEKNLSVIYILCAVVMLVNGLISHKMWLKQFEDEN